MYAINKRVLMNRMFIKKTLFLFTILNLRQKQIFYRIYYLIRSKYRYLINFSYPLLIEHQIYFLNLVRSVVDISLYKNTGFIFLNKNKQFISIINWNYSKYGKLWTYNLTYFDYLQQKDMTKEEGVKLIYDFIEQSDNIKDGFMPFPISLRGTNWIKFLSKHKINDPKINNSLYAQYMILMDNIEYHILGNHLLENGFSLLFGAYYFQDEKLYAKAKKILTEELEEQILSDGAHFELSPMYHQIMLFRVLDCINLVQNNNWKKHELLDVLTAKAEIMLRWLHTMTYQNGNIPLLNDSANKIAPTTKELIEYALRLNSKFKIQHSNLSDSGYRKIENERYEMVIDVGNIGPDYIPGHAHSDTFNFELYIDGNPFIVDTGLSTYENNARRMLERSTFSHNTVEIDGENQSEMWSAFRVARRAKIIYLKESDNYIEATHDGYRRIGALHTRKFITYNNYIVIEDTIESSGKHQGIAYLHFYPGILPEVKDNKIIILNRTIKLNNADKLTIETYKYAPEFNKLIDAFQVKVEFKNYLRMEIHI